MAATKHPSDSSHQQAAEGLIRDGVADALGITLSKKRLKLGDGASVEIDAVDDEEGVFVEIFAHQGALKGGQKHKVKGDLLKLVTLAKDRSSPRLILAFGDEEAARFALERTWVAEAVKAWGVEVLVVELDEAVREGLRAVQVRQVMLNPPGS